MIKTPEYNKFIKSLDSTTAKKISSKVERFSTGKGVNLKPIRTCNDGAGSKRLYEIIVDYGPGYRIYCHKDKNDVRCLYGGIKKNQKHDIECAKNLMET